MYLKDIAPTVGFGTSGVRALVADLTPAVVAAYARVFIQHLRRSGQMRTGTTHCVVGWDLRPSSPRIAAAVCAGLRQEGLEVEWARCLPTPALALRALQTGSPGIMVTGSHIPFDRNGIKFYTAQGEILKADEAAMNALPLDTLPTTTDLSHLFDGCVAEVTRPAIESPALTAYTQRYVQLLPAQALKGLRIGVYQHSAVGRDLLVELLTQLGATGVPIGRSDQFVPIDTEAVSAEDEAMAAQWCQQHQLDGVVSKDGDGDRPWVCDELGRFIRGDVLGTLTAQWLGITTVVTPVSSNTVVERSGHFNHTERTRIGSPYVIEAMQALERTGHTCVAGFEANGGFLLQTPVKGLQALPTRDSLLPILAILVLSKESGQALSALPHTLPARFTHSGRLQGIPAELSQPYLSSLSHNPEQLADFVSFSLLQARETNKTDGLRITLTDGSILHLRASGNAPELRCYTEAETPEKALQLLSSCLQQLRNAFAAHA